MFKLPTQQLPAFPVQRSQTNPIFYCDKTVELKMTARAKNMAARLNWGESLLNFAKVASIDPMKVFPAQDAQDLCRPTGCYGSGGEYVREMICKDQDCLHIRGLLLVGPDSAPTVPLDPSRQD